MRCAAEVDSEGGALRRATIDFTFDGGVLRGHVVLEGSLPVAFSGIGELQRCLGLEHGHLLLMNGGAQTGAEGTPSRATLTETERRIVEAALTGASNREIAEATFYSVKSIEAYLTRIYRRFGISGRSELAQVLALAPTDDPGQPGDAPGSVPWTSRPVVVQLLAV